jgi:imidazolonepropionase-like amidohydrolase
MRVYTSLIAAATLALIQAQPAVDSGTVLVSLIERPVGRETYELKADGQGFAFSGELDLTERNGRLQVSSLLRTGADLTPLSFTAKGKSYRFVNVDTEVNVAGGVAEVKNLGVSTRTELPKQFFTATGYAPLAARAMLIRYWERHGKPPHLAVVPGSPTRDVRIEYRGEDSVRMSGNLVRLRRYSVDGIVWGRETVWLDESDRFAAIVSRIHILPIEGIREDLKAALPLLQAASIQDRMGDLESEMKATAPVADKSFALVGAKLIDGTGRTPIDDATIIVQDGRIAAAGPRSSTAVPSGMKVMNARGTTIVPGLWDMHAHAANIEWLPAYLGAGVTTIRDMGGEQAYLTALRDTVASGRGFGPRVLLAGLVDGDAPAAFGATVAATPEQGRAVVDRYHAAGFQQMKLYSLLQPEVVAAINARAHDVGMTVTGHVPTSLGTMRAVEAGMDHVAHLPINGDPGSPQNKELIALMVKRQTVVDPTLPWNELLGHAPDTAIESFEPGFAHANPALAMNYRSVKNDTDLATAKKRLRDQEVMVKALFDAGVPIVAGTDGGLPGYSLLRSLELYVEAGLTPMQAIESATRVPAKAMGMEAEVGTIEAGKRADMIVLTADPLAAISNIRKLKWVIANGRALDPAPLWRTAGFR